MKVAFVNQPIDTILPPGQNSVGACTYNVAHILAKSCDVVVYGLKDSNKTLASEFVDQGVNYKFLPSTRVDRWLFRAGKNYSRLSRSAPAFSTSSLLYPGFARQVAKDLQREACDVIHIQHCSQFARVIREYNPLARIVLHLHAEWFSQSGFGTFEKRLKDVDLITTVSGYVAERTLRDFRAATGRCEVAYNGIDAREFTREKNYRSAIGKEKRILYAGAISPHRGLHILLEAFTLVVKQYPNIHLDLVGPQGNYPMQDTFDIRHGALRKSVAPYYTFKPLSLLKARLMPGSQKGESYVPALKAMMPAEVAERVTFHGMVGHRPQLIEHYYQSDLFVLPSICDDSFGIPIVEAMAAGVPVVASRSGGVVETVKDRVTGFIVEKNDPQQMARSILKLLQDDALREAMGRAGRKRAMDKFTWDELAQTMLVRYQRLSGIGSSLTAQVARVSILEYAAATTSPSGERSGAKSSAKTA